LPPGGVLLPFAAVFLRRVGALSVVALLRITGCPT
jgi:hypothetical protein